MLAPSDRPNRGPGPKTSLCRPPRPRLAERRLRRGKPGDRHAEGRAGDVVERHRLAESDAGGIAAVLAADAELDPGARFSPALGRDLYEFADALLVERHEGIARQ